LEIKNSFTAHNVIPKSFYEGSAVRHAHGVQTADPSQKQLGMTVRVGQVAQLPDTERKI
jgi:hypothetical protein